MERELIIQFVEENKGVIENKSGDILSVKRRREKWQELEGLFLGNGPKRNWWQLRNAYQKMKAHAKKAISEFTKRGSDGDVSSINNPSGEDWRMMEIVPADFNISDDVKLTPPASLLEPLVKISNVNRKRKSKDAQEEATKLHPEQIRQKRDHDEKMNEIMKKHILLKNELEITKMELDIDVARLQKEKLELEIKLLNN